MPRAHIGAAAPDDGLVGKSLFRRRFDAVAEASEPLRLRAVKMTRFRRGTI